MLSIFDAKMKVKFKDREDPLMLNVLVIAPSAADVVEKGPEIMKQKYESTKSTRAEKIEFFSVHQNSRIDFVIPEEE